MFFLTINISDASTFLTKPTTRPKLDSARRACALNHPLPLSEMDERGSKCIPIFPGSVFLVFSIVFLTGLMSYFSTLVFQSLPLSQWDWIAHHIIFRVRKNAQDFCRLWFALIPGRGQQELELEPGGPALAGPVALHHHPGAVRQRLRPADVLHGLQHLRKQLVEMWPVPMLLSWAALSEHGGPQSRRTWVSVPCSSVLSSPPPFATCSTAWRAAVSTSFHDS